LQLLAVVYGTYLVVYERFRPFTKKKKCRKAKKERRKCTGKKKMKLQSYEGVMHFCEESCTLGYLQDPFIKYGSSTSLHPNEARYICFLDN
jgi:hypothetical protein